MNIHEHQAKEILKEFGAPVSNGIVIFDVNEIKQKIKKLTSKKYVLKAQIRGEEVEAGGVKLIDKESLQMRQKMMETLITHQTGPSEKEVKTIHRRSLRNR